MGFAGRLLQRLEARVHACLGWTWYRLGCRVRARRHYERVLLLRGGDFAAYVHLGLIAFALGDYGGWRREFEHARRLDPARFAQMRHPFELFEPRLAGTNFDETGERATWRSLRPFASPSRRATMRADGLEPGGLDSGGLDSGGLDLGATGGEPGRDARARNAESRAAAPDGSADYASPDHDGAAQPRPLHGDDFCSLAERRRFRSLRPIAAQEVGSCDLDDLARRLGG